MVVNSELHENLIRSDANDLIDILTKGRGQYGLSIYGWDQDDWGGIDYTNEGNITDYSSLIIDYNSHLLYPGFHIISPSIVNNGELCLEVPTSYFSNKETISILSPKLINIHFAYNGRVTDRRVRSFRL